MMAYIVLHYDMKLEEGVSRHPPIHCLQLFRLSGRYQLLALAARVPKFDKLRDSQNLATLTTCTLLLNSKMYGTN